MECVNCGRRNQPTTRFCAECGDVLHADPPRERRARKVRQRKRRLRIHWVRMPPSPPPSILTVRLEPSAAADAAQRAPERMMRRIDLALAAIVGIAGLAAYFAYPYLKGSPAETPVVAMPAVEAPMVASAPMPPLDPPPPRAPADERPAPLTVPGTMAPASVVGRAHARRRAAPRAGASRETRAIAQPAGELGVELASCVCVADGFRRGGRAAAGAAAGARGSCAGAFGTSQGPPATDERHDRRLRERRPLRTPRVRAARAAVVLRWPVGQERAVPERAYRRLRQLTRRSRAPGGARLECFRTGSRPRAAPRPSLDGDPR